jgi:cysteine dioxygenase
MGFHLRSNGEVVVVQVELSKSDTLELETNSPEIKKFIMWLDGLNGRPTLNILERKLLDLNIDLKGLEKYLGYTDNGYQRNVIKKTENYELVLICWKAGQKTPIHNHNGSDCAFLILEGISTESIYEIQSERLFNTKTRRYSPGEVCAADEPDIHRISNDEDSNLVNLHLYSPPLAEFKIYKDE